METRVDQWKRKLLDLSLRNQLLNARDGAKFLPFDGGTPYGGGAATTEVVPYTPPEAGDSVPFRTNLPEKEIRKRLKELYLASRLSYNETGVNSLYVAVGFLSWREKDGDEFHQAPLLLIPAQLVRQTASPGYKLQRTDEDAAVNFCLLELLRSQFGIPIKDVAGGGFGDGDPDFNAVFRCFADAIQNKKDWSISTGIALGIFSFSKVVIWKDLTDHFDEFRRNPFVAHLAEGTGLYDDGVKVFPPEDVEKHIRPAELLCPLSADSSQLRAVLYSELGKSFVLHGPPGTGKSQTITNIIADNLAKGKRVLFVSEKRAALDVVYKRLSSVGLAPFCLELHSNKCDKANVMRQFSEALGVTPSRKPSKWAQTCSDVEAAFSEIGAYVRDLHKPCANGMTAWNCMARHAGRHPQADASLISMNAADVPNDALVALGKVVQELAEEWKSVDKADYDSLQCVCVNDWSPGFETSVGEHVSAILDALSEPKMLKRTLKVFWRAMVARFKGTVKYPFFEGTLEDRRAKMQGVKDHLDGLRLVLSYRINRRRAVKADCLKFVEALECGRFVSDEAVRVFEDSCAEKTLNTLISRSRGLSGFSGIKHEERIARFRELDESYTAAAQKMIVAMLSKKRDAIEHPPVVKDKDGNTVVHAMDPELQRQMAILKRECEKKKRFMPPRKLLSETKNLAIKLKPCFLMSPLSVAQYLPVDGDLFDMVVFDEASQMTVWDAIGVIARGKQLIVVGDPKQLPPTNFFVKGDVKDEDREDDPATEDLESVLDECLANGLYSAYLNWHYRSRHESLIAFSNRHYYEDRLNTFPAAEVNERLGVSFRYVDGALYDHVSHTNKNEAEALVDFLFERLEKTAERKRSWGIVTFSVAQQKLVEDLIDKRSEGCDWAADFFDDSKPDAFFVKNLENVQGDERDVIIFSIAYAPDAQGRFAMSFGPINRPGGERRLNVAITRAREQVVIFASTHSSEIHAERTNSVGVKHLKALMEYAETGHLEGDVVKDDGREATGIKKAVCDCLAANGYSFETDVGMSSYPVDVAVRDPKNQNRFVLGIECDGERYAAQHTVRDRDVLRDSVREGMGWKILHAWSVDWTFDRKRAERRLLEALSNHTEIKPGPSCKAWRSIITALLSFCLANAGCICITGEKTYWQKEFNDVYFSGPGVQDAQERRYEDVKYAENDGKSIAIGLLPGAGELWNCGKVHYSSWQTLDSWAIYVPSALIANCFVCPIIDSLLVEPFGDGEYSGAGLIGCHRWVAESCGKRRIDGRSIERVIVSQGTYDRDVPAPYAILGEHTRVYFEYPGFTEVFTFVDNGGVAYVLHEDGKTVRKFTKAKKVQGMLTYDDMKIQLGDALGRPVSFFLKCKEFKNRIAAAMSHTDDDDAKKRLASLIDSVNEKLGSPFFGTVMFKDSDDEWFSRMTKEFEYEKAGATAAMKKVEPKPSAKAKSEFDL